MQSGPIQSELFVRPPASIRNDRMMLWKLTILPYGVVEAGRQ